MINQMEKIVSLHQDEYLCTPEVVVEAPGAATLMGNYVEFDEGFMIQAALETKIFVSVSRRKDNSLKFYAADFSERKKASAVNIKYKREDRWANYIKSILFALENSGNSFKGLDITVTGNVSQGIGLSSFSAIEAAVLIAVKNLYNFPLEEKDLIKLSYIGEEKFLVSGKAPSGIYASLYGKSGNFLFIDHRSGEVEYIPWSGEDYSFVLTVSNVPQIPVENEIAERRKDIKKCMLELTSFKSGNSLRDYTKLDLLQGLDFVPEQTKRRGLHVVEEIARACEFKIALEKEDMVGVGKIMNRSHESLRDNFEVSCPEIDWLVKRAQETEGVLGSKITGAGFGGCTITLLKNSAIERYKQKLEEYDRIFGFKADMIKCSATDAAKVLYLANREL